MQGKISLIPPGIGVGDIKSFPLLSGISRFCEVMSEIQSFQENMPSSLDFQSLWKSSQHFHLPLESISKELAASCRTHYSNPYEHETVHYLTAICMLYSLTHYPGYPD